MTKKRETRGGRYDITNGYGIYIFIFVWTASRKDNE